MSLGRCPAVTAPAQVTDFRMVTLQEIAEGRVDLVAEKMKAIPQKRLDDIKRLVRMFMDPAFPGFSFRLRSNFLNLQKLVQGRVDLTPAMLQMAHPVQLVLLVSLKTGLLTYLDPTAVIPHSHLSEVLLDSRCPDITCQSPLPVDNCHCHICTSRKGFCRYCLCMICSTFDSESDKSSWVGCDACFHWAHTRCAIDAGQIEAGQITQNGKGQARMLFRCKACLATSELLGWVTAVFQQCALGWNRGDLFQELNYICKIFHPSEDTQERAFFRKCAELLQRIRTGSPESMYRPMLLEALEEMNDQDQMVEGLARILLDASEEPVELSYEFLENITDDFSQVIGRGGFGEVYMGHVRNKKMAVKKLFQTSHFSEKQFRDELACLIRVKHKNIARFLGYCSETQHKAVEYNGQFVLAEDRRRFLCFEYVPNKSLHDYLKDESHRHDWDTHYKLIKGICQGLHYLHKKERITHLDLKPENILLDADMVPKITDFGLSRRFSGGQSRIITENIRGSQGYIAPESVAELASESWWYESLDKESPQVKTCIEIALLCVDDDPRKRPTIDNIIGMLSGKDTVTNMTCKVPDHSRNNSRSSKEQVRKFWLLRQKKKVSYLKEDLGEQEIRTLWSAPS
ncbi:hypothetical protein ACP4OV_002368 [Aristida adscensionis]